MKPNVYEAPAPNPNVRKPRDPYHVARMIRRRERQNARTANCDVWSVKPIGVDPTGRMVYAPRGDEQGAYRAKHWKRAA